MHTSLKLRTSLIIIFLLSSCGGPIDCPEAYQSYLQHPSGVISPVYLQQNQAQRTSIDVAAFIITGEVKSTSFNLDFDSTKMIYDGYLTGNFFEQLGGQASYAVNTAPGSDHTLMVSISRDGSGLGATGGGVIVTLKFKLISEGTSSISFSNNHLLDPNGQEITTDAWTGATIIIERLMCL